MRVIVRSGEFADVVSVHGIVPFDAGSAVAMAIARVHPRTIVDVFAPVVFIGVD
jgi:hypothetical protein